MNFRTLTKEDMPKILEYRNQCSEALRTPFNLTIEQQEEFYKNIICNRSANAKYWAIDLKCPKRLIGMCGIENIEWTNKLGEISIVLDSNIQGKGYGSQVFWTLLEKGFNQIGLVNIYGECYTCNKATEFWLKMIEQFGGTKTYLPNRKYWNGYYWDSLYFNFNVIDWHTAISSIEKSHNENLKKDFDFRN